MVEAPFSFSANQVVVFLRDAAPPGGCRIQADPWLAPIPQPSSEQQPG